MMRRTWSLVASVTIVASLLVFAACNIQPQPLPPGERDDGDGIPTGAPRDPGAGGEVSARDSGVPAAPVPSDGAADGGASLDDAASASDAGRDAGDAGDGAPMDGGGDARTDSGDSALAD